MNKEIVDYIQDVENDINNFNLALWYENQKHLSPACSFYLRCSEFTEDSLLAYECLIRLYSCYLSLSNRDYTCENLLKTAINLRPNSPEAYFLISQFYERRGNWMDSYLYASLGLNNTDGNSSGFRNHVGYEGKYCLIFQKAISSWWYGKPKETRFLLRSLRDDYSEVMNNGYRQLVQNNLSRLGSGPTSQSTVPYLKGKNLRFEFEGYKDIENNFSQVYQDIFVLSMLNGKKDGTYLEIGASEPFHNSNTALLEKLGWTGVGLEIDNNLIENYNKHRKNKALCKDALAVNYSSLISENFSSEVIDYLQLDIEPSKNTFEAMLAIPFDKYKFRVITYEHDYYVDMTKSYRDKSRNYLSSMGYTLVVKDISPDNNSPFEDWWVNKELVDAKMLQKFIDQEYDSVNMVEKFMLK